ncbi:DUF523 domain-containing protein [Pandoraea apista]|uniref:DUF523 domain-containing protein n=1 Tax=Pandoraea apista TaxID=93218 RepID=UPI000657F410|nr:DUF523 domain-containing protein [Pandoraea apista]ALS67551.1 purine-nucleoside phosphorylase [Pandoraea apista]RRW95860.1 DUF523 domain-containing protein [Pandoraea apista]RRX05991.1 DUF523 domain-containing protein [Pandoraea apista]CFB60187.1 hypothetical protein LMG16407_00222 [Pandoraea apista]
MSTFPRILVSSCLLGHPVRYHGRTAPCESHAAAILERWQANGFILPICPEVAGGLPTPRPPAEIAGATGGNAVWQKHSRVIDNTGADVTEAFLEGAQRALALAQRYGIRIAVLKEGSPSCGSTSIYDGSFSGRQMAGEGVAAAWLRQHGIEVFSEHTLAEADERLRAIDTL